MNVAMLHHVSWTKNISSGLTQQNDQLHYIVILSIKTDFYHTVPKYNVNRRYSLLFNEIRRGHEYRDEENIDVSVQMKLSKFIRTNASMWPQVLQCFFWAWMQYNYIFVLNVAYLEFCAVEINYVNVFWWYVWVRSS